MSNYPGNYVAWHTGGGDPCCPDWKESNRYGIKEHEFCFICGESIEICGGEEVAGEVVCAECYEYNGKEECEKSIKKLK